eukprot:1444196-Pleurochrysis_carterae.AAC.4
MQRKARNSKTEKLHEQSTPLAIRATENKGKNINTASVSQPRQVSPALSALGEACRMFRRSVPAHSTHSARRS